MIGNDCVVIPDWGAFIAQYYTSEVDLSTHSFSKPSRRIGFNASIKHNDGLLATSIMRKHGVTYKEAEKLIKENVAVYKQLLQAHTEIPFGRLGFFTNSESGTLEFIPFYHEESNDAFFGLMDFTFSSLLSARQALSQSQASTKAGIKSTGSTTSSGESKNWLTSRALQIAASIIILLGLVFVFSTPVVLDKQQQLATMNMAKIAQDSQAPTVAYKEAKKAPVSPTVAIASDSSRKIEKPKAKNSKKKVHAQLSIEKKDTLPTFDNTGEGRYYLVISTLTNNNQVKAYLASHQDFKGIAKVRVKNGKYRIYIERGDNYGEMIKKARSLPKEYNDAWVTTD